MEAIQQTLELPYPELKTFTNRDQLRDTLKAVGGKPGRQMYHVPVTQITVRDGFNWRMKPEDVEPNAWLYHDDHLGIDTLADGILATGKVPPLQVDMTAEGIFVITDGFRRYHAIHRLLERGVTEFENGEPVDMVEVSVNPKETTELDRMLAIFTTQENKKLRPLEVAHGLLRIKQHYGLSHEKIAKMIGKSRQYVDQKIALAAEPVEIQQAVSDGRMSATAATALRNNGSSKEERVEAVQTAIESGETIKVADAKNKPVVVEAPDDDRKITTSQSKTAIIDTDAADAAEEASHKTSAKGNDPDAKRQAREKAENNLSLDLAINVSKEKEEAEFGLNESIKMIDKIRVTYLKGMEKGNLEDVTILFDAIIKRISAARAFIQAAPESR